MIAADSPGDVLAGRFTRFAAAMVDGLLLMAILLPIQFVTGYTRRVAVQQVGTMEHLAMSLLGIMTMLVLNAYLLVGRGQTIGKALTGIQIVEFNSGELLPFVRVYCYRYLWSLPLFLVVFFIPGWVDDQIVNTVVFIDILLIFGASRRCFHDYVAGSKVVQYRAHRRKLT